MLTCCFDLERNLPTYDVVNFALDIERDRIHLGEDELKVEVQLSNKQRGLWPFSHDERMGMVRSVVVPMLTMLPSCGDVKLIDPGQVSAGRGRRQFVGSERFACAIREGIRPLRPRKAEWPRDDKLITMTLREAEHWPKRNSQVDEWHFAAQRLEDEGYRVIVVRDTAKSHDSFGKIRTAPLASVDLEVRALLYRSAALNMFVNNGPAWFCCALDAPTVVLRPATEGAGKLSGEAAVRRARTGEGFPPHQQVIWKDDTSSNIVEAAVEFMETRYVGECA